MQPVNGWFAQAVAEVVVVLSRSSAAKGDATIFGPGPPWTELAVIMMSKYCLASWVHFTCGILFGVTA